MEKIDLFDIMNTVVNGGNEPEDMNITSAFICVAQENPEEKGKFEMRCRATGPANFLFSSMLEYARTSEEVRGLFAAVLCTLAEEEGTLKISEEEES